MKTDCKNLNPAPILTPFLVLHWPDEAATAQFAQTLATKPALCNAFIELEGDLGAGKTTLARYLLRALGVQGRVKSPTYTVVEPYEVPDLAPGSALGLSIWHFDFYRFTDPREWEEAGFRDLFTAPGLKLAEWAINARAALPQPDLTVKLTTQDDDSRQVELHAHTAIGQALIA